MGRGKIRICRIENKTTRQVTFAKRRAGLLKKTHELAVLCDAHIGLIIFSSNGKLYDYCSNSDEASSMEKIIQRYQVATGSRVVEYNDTNTAEELQGSVRRMRNETRNLEATMQRYTGEDLSSVSIEELDQLECMLDHSLINVRARKFELLQQQMDNLHTKEQMMEQENAQIYHMIKEQEAAMMLLVSSKTSPSMTSLLEQFPFAGEAQPTSVLHLASSLLPTHPNLHHF